MAPKPTHSILGASGASRWLSCPGSVRLSKGMPNISSDYAKEGVAAHELGEMCLRTKKNAADHLGSVITVQGSAYEVTEEMAEAVQLYLDTVRADLDSITGADLRIEHKFHLDWLYPGLYGTNDCLVGEPFGILRVYDFKYGAGVAIDAEDNVQTMYYGLGAAKGDAYEEVELVIVQPRATHSQGPVRRCRMTIDELFRWGNEVLLPGAKATEDKDAPYNMGDHCRFCPALAVCPLPKERAMTVAASVFAPVPVSPPDPETLDYAVLRKALDVSSIVEAWFKACHAHARALLETKKATPEELGYKLVEGRATRKWADEAKAKGWLEGVLGGDAYVVKFVSPAQAEKLLKKDAKPALEGMVATTRGVQMVPVSDKRPAIEGAGDVFEAVEE